MLEFNVDFRFLASLVNCKFLKTKPSNYTILESVSTQNKLFKFAVFDFNQYMEAKDESYSTESHSDNGRYALSEFDEDHIYGR